MIKDKKHWWVMLRKGREVKKIVYIDISAIKETQVENDLFFFNLKNPLWTSRR